MSRTTRFVVRNVCPIPNSQLQTPARRQLRDFPEFPRSSRAAAAFTRSQTSAASPPAGRRRQDDATATRAHARPGPALPLPARSVHRRPRLLPTAGAHHVSLLGVLVPCLLPYVHSRLCRSGEVGTTRRQAHSHRSTSPTPNPRVGPALRGVATRPVSDGRDPLDPTTARTHMSTNTGFWCDRGPWSYRGPERWSLTVESDFAAPMHTLIVIYAIKLGMVESCFADRIVNDRVRVCTTTRMSTMRMDTMHVVFYYTLPDVCICC